MLSLQDVCYNHIIVNLGMFPPEALSRLSIGVRCRLLSHLPAAVVWYLESTAFSRGLDTETVWRDLCGERLARSASPFNLDRGWACYRGTERCLNSSHDRGTMASVGFPFVFHQCIVTASDVPTLPSTATSPLVLSSRDVYFLCLWKVLYSVNSFNENRDFLEDILFSCSMPVLGRCGLVPSSHPSPLLGLITVPSLLRSERSRPFVRLVSSSIQFIPYVTELLRFIVIDCLYRPTALYVNTSYLFLTEQASETVRALLNSVSTLSAEYTGAAFRSILKATLSNPSPSLLLGIRGIEPATDLTHFLFRSSDKRLILDFSFNGRAGAECELAGLIDLLSHSIVWLEVTLHSVLEANRKLVDSCIALAQRPQVIGLYLDGVLTASAARSIIAKYLMTPCSAPQKLELKSILPCKEGTFDLLMPPVTRYQDSDCWKFKSVFVSSELGEFSSWLLSLSFLKIFSLELIDLAANFEGNLLSSELQVERFRLCISGSRKMDSRKLMNILLATASPVLKQLYLHLTCKTSAGATDLLHSLALFVSKQAKLGTLQQLHIRFHDSDSIADASLALFFRALFDMPRFEELNFWLECKSCDCNDSLVLTLWQSHGRRVPLKFYLRTSSVEWSTLQHEVKVN